MLACTETITLVRMEYDPLADADAYTCTPIYGVSWYGKLVAAVESKGLRGETKVIVRIPEDNMQSGSIQRGDIIVRGKVYHIDKRTELEGLEYFKVLSVGDNRRSRRKELRHWVVSGA